MILLRIYGTLPVRNFPFNRPIVTSAFTGNPTVVAAYPTAYWEGPYARIQLNIA